MLSGKFLRVRKVFEIRTYFRPTALYLRICLLDFPECLDFFNIFFTASEPSRLLGRFPKNLDWLQTNTPESFQFILSGNFTECLESFAQYGFLSGNLPDFLEDIQVVWKLSRLSWNLPDFLEDIQVVLKLSTLSWNLMDFLEDFQVVWKFSRLFGNLETWKALNFPGTARVVWKHACFEGYPGCLETFQAVWKPARFSGGYPGFVETFQPVWKPARFLEDIQVVWKRSGYLKTYPQLFISWISPFLL